MPQEPSFDQINKELDNELARLGLNPQQTQPTNQQQQAGPTPEDYARLQGEISALKDMMEQQGRRFVNENNQVQTPTPEPAQKLERWALTPDKFVESAAKDPGQAVLDAINSKLGLPEGTNAFGLFDVVGKRLNELDTQNKQLQDCLQSELLERHAERFVDTHPEYEPTEDNYRTLQGYMNQYQLPPTVQGYELALARALQDGKIQVQEQQQPQQQSYEPQAFDNFGRPMSQAPRGPQFVPSVSQRNSSPSETDINSVLSKLDRMPLAEAQAYAEKLFRGQ